MNMKGTRLATLVVLAWLPACGGDSSGNPDGSDTPGEAADESTGADADGDVPADPGDTPIEAGDEGTIPDTTPDGAPCGTTQCSNCIDDDGDGFTDGFDPHCSSAADDDEGTFATGISGDNIDRYWQDCFYDGNSGGGDDGCRYHTCCLLGAACPSDISSHGGGFDPMRDCEISAACIDFCMPAVTPGCDCFGCCEIWVDGTAYTVFTNPAVAPDCTLDVIDDPALCLPCTPTTDCGNPCVPEDCELCPGMTVDDLPAECDPTIPVCDPGITPCPTGTGCPAGFYCSVGCCIEDVILT